MGRLNCLQFISLNGIYAYVGNNIIILLRRIAKNVWVINNLYIFYACR